MSEVMGYRRLNEAFQYVDDELLDIVEQEKSKAKKTKKRPAWRFAGAIAACILILILPVGVLAARLFGLWDLILPREEKDYTHFTLLDFAGCQEVKALRAWEQFRAGYDTDMTVFHEAMENGFAPEGREDWLMYGVYSYEMGEKLDKIAKRYGLALHTSAEYVTFEELQDRVGGSFLPDTDIEFCQVYEDGSFYMKGNTELEGYGKTAFYLHCVVRGTLNQSIPIWWDSEYDHWQYEAAYGGYTDLMLGARRAEILTGSEDRILLAVVFEGQEAGMTQEDLQELADKIDFGVLKEMQLPEGSRDKPIAYESSISLSGYVDSPESKALAEWEEFLVHYDVEQKIADELGNGVFVAEGREDWSQYRVYSYEMGEKLDEIAAKYGLKLHTDINVVNGEDLIDRVGGEFMEDLEGAYIYEDGYFGFDGDVELSGCGMTGYQFCRSVKGTFNEVALNIGQAVDYTDWQYTTSCGETVILALGSYKALILGDFDKCFVTVNVLLGSEEGMTEEDLQEFADKIDFRILKDVKVPEMKGDTAGLPADELLLSEKFYGEVGKLGSGALVITVPHGDQEDYRLYFFEDKTGEGKKRFNVKKVKLEDADYVFPDAREGNMPIGTFQTFEVFRLGDIGKDGSGDILLVGIYGVDEELCLDARVYTESGEGYVLNTALTQELNEKFHYYKDYNYWDILRDVGL